MIKMVTIMMMFKRTPRRRGVGGWMGVVSHAKMVLRQLHARRDDGKGG